MTTWILLRAAGIGAYVALFLSVAWGLLASASLTPRRVAKPSANLFHAAVASTGLLLLAVHVALLLVDRFMPFHVLDLLVPLRSSYRPVAVALGIVAMYATVAVVATSWLRPRVGTAWWRRTHLLAGPAFALTMLHGVLAGTDTGRPWMIALYFGTGGVTLFLVLVRGMTARVRPAVRRDAATDPAQRPAGRPDRRDGMREPVSAA